MMGACDELPCSQLPFQPPLPSGHLTLLMLTTVKDEPCALFKRGKALLSPEAFTESGEPFRQVSRIGSMLSSVMMSVAWLSMFGPLFEPVVMAVIVVAPTLSNVYPSPGGLGRRICPEL